MSHFHRSGARLQEREDREDAPRSPFAEVAGRFAGWIAGVDRSAGADDRSLVDDADDPLQALIARPDDDDGSDAGPADAPTGGDRFPLAPFGYNRAAVDDHLRELERELEELRVRHEPAMSITEELERIGEQTASILVVAHDKAHETTRRAQEQAERCIADAAANAVAITEEAQRRLRELDGETDVVWRERERLLEDVRVVSAALASLADEASARFPAAEPAPAAPFPASAAPFPASAAPFPASAAPFPAPAARTPLVDDPEATQSWPVAGADGAEAQDAEDGHPDGGEARGGFQDTGSWLAGFEPPPDFPGHA